MQWSDTFIIPRVDVRTSINAYPKKPLIPDTQQPHYLAEESLVIPRWVSFVYIQPALYGIAKRSWIALINRLEQLVPAVYRQTSLLLFIQTMDPSRLTALPVAIAAARQACRKQADHSQDTCSQKGRIPQCLHAQSPMSVQFPLRQILHAECRYQRLN
jgi:hypothetical protein